LLVAATVGLGVSACRHDDSRSDVGEASSRESIAQPERVIHGFGLGLWLPPGWRGRVFAAPENATARLAVLQAATLPLAHDDDVFGSTTSARMAADDARIVLMEFPAEQVGSQGFRPITLPLSLGRADFDRHPAVPADHVLARRRFALAGRPFSLFVEFGRRQPDAGQLALVRRLLAHLTITPRPEANEAYSSCCRHWGSSPPA